MLQERQRKLAHPEIPVRMSCPLDLQFIAIIKGHLDVLTHKFIHYRAIVDALDRNQLSIFLIVQPTSLLHDFSNIDDWNPPGPSREQEIGQRFLMEGINF